MLADRVRMGSGKSEFIDIWGTPGSAKLIAGDGEVGFFGEVPASEFITGVSLASQIPMYSGTSANSTAGWLKFAYKGEILFVAKKPIRYSIPWTAISNVKCVYGDSGDKTVTIDDKTYKVTLMRGANDKFDPKQYLNEQTDGYRGEPNHGSEWNRLMCQIHEKTLDKSWNSPSNVETDIGILEHSLGSGSQGMYNDNDLLTHYNHGHGSYSWCQEMSTRTSFSRLSRGGEGVSYTSSRGSGSDYAHTGYGWRPVLRLVK